MHRLNLHSLSFKINERDEKGKGDGDDLNEGQKYLVKQRQGVRVMQQRVCGIRVDDRAVLGPGVKISACIGAARGRVNFRVCATRDMRRE